MQILFLTQVLPYPLDAGPKTRAYYVLRHLAEAGHDVTLLSFVRATDSDESVDHLRDFCQTVRTVPMTRSGLKDVRHLLRSLPGATPFLIARDWVPVMAEAIDSLCAATEYDAVHADQLWMGPYAERAAQQLRQRTGEAPLLVLDQHNAVFQIPARMAAGSKNPAQRALLSLEARKLIRYEAEICRRFDRVVWVTAEDLAALEAEAGYASSQPRHDSVIPICVDPTLQPVISPVEKPCRVTFLGGLHWPPNAEGIVWFAEQVWPRIVAAQPDALLTIIGKNPPAALQNSSGPMPNVEVTGYVDDPLPLLAETAAFIVPLHAGGGMRVKILDAWQWGLPVISTTIGAEGIAVTPGENMLLGDSPAEFAAATQQVLADPQLQKRLRRGGRHAAETIYDWRTTYRDWNQVYASSKDWALAGDEVSVES